MEVSRILEDLIKASSTLSPVVVVDEEGIFEEYLTGKEYVYSLSGPFQIELTKVINARSKPCIYLRQASFISGPLSSGQLKRLTITPDMLFNEIAALSGKITDSLDLNGEQYKILLRNFSSVAEGLSSYERVDKDALLKVLAQHVSGRRMSVRTSLIAILNGALEIGRFQECNLYQCFCGMAENELQIPLIQITDFQDLLPKVMITYSLKCYSEYGGSGYAGYLLDEYVSAWRPLAMFVMDNAGELSAGLERLNEIYRECAPGRLTYAVPRLYLRYVSEHFTSYQAMDAGEEPLWTGAMKLTGSFILCCQTLDRMLHENVGYVSVRNTMDQLWRDYKSRLCHMDTAYREMEAKLEQLSFCTDFYFGRQVHRVVSDLKRRYHNVIRITNGRLLSCYHTLMKERAGVKRQSEFMDSIPFSPRTLFVFADGFRYEMAGTLSARFAKSKIEDFDVIGELPSETEVGMNSYFITDERLRFNKHNLLELTRDHKTVRQIYDWRQRKLSERLHCQVIRFETFKQTKDYEGSVICFFDEADMNMHHYDSAGKMDEAINNLEKIVRYGLERQYDVMLLSDHGFVDIEMKLDLQDKNIDADKKKSRYLIMNKGEKADSMYYCDTIPVADYLDPGHKKFCFINSTNSLRETGRYNHGGVSLQENVITALRFRGAPGR